MSQTKKCVFTDTKEKSGSAKIAVISLFDKIKKSGNLSAPNP